MSNLRTRYRAWALRRSTKRQGKLWVKNHSAMKAAKR